MTHLRLTMVFLTLLLFSSCSTQLQQRERGQAIVEHQREQQQERDPMLTFRYRPGRGLTISGDLDYYLGERTSRD